MRRTFVLCGLAVLASVAAAGLWTTAADAANGPELCAPPAATRIVDRTVHVWYGTLTIKSASGAVLSTSDAVELDDPLSAGLGSIISLDESVDRRVAAALTWPSPWIVGLTNFDWLMGGPADPSAEEKTKSALLVAFTAAGSAAGPGSLVPGTETASTRPYAFEEFTDPPAAGPVWVGDTDDPVQCGSDGESITVSNILAADVRFHELNATYTLAPPEPTGDALCQQLSDYVTGSTKYKGGSARQRLVPNGLVMGACTALRLIKPSTPIHIKCVLVLGFKIKVDLLKVGGWLSTEQAKTLKSLADAL